jgi:transposase-like protein
MRTGTFEKFKGEVEVDETFIGGRARNMHAERNNRRGRGTGGVGKAVVLGMLERGGEVKAMHVRNTRKATLLPEVKENIEPGTQVFTDALPSYNGLDPDYAHEVIDHAIAYVRGKVHTNGMENFWSLLKRAIKGTYVSVEPAHLVRYVDEEVFRFNKRKTNDAERFLKAVGGIIGRRLTYEQLIGKLQPA